MTPIEGRGVEREKACGRFGGKVSCILSERSRERCFDEKSGAPLLTNDLALGE